MNNHTQANPFKFEGVEVWLSEHGNLRFNGNLSVLSHQEARAIAAFINAESNPPTWTEQPDGTWRKGRWIAFPFMGKWRVNHDDFPVPIEGQCLAFENDEDQCGNIACSVAQDQLTDFLTFHAAHTKPEFKPLDVPDVGQWGEFTLRDGCVVEGEVVEATNYGDHARVKVDGKWLTMNLSADMEESCKWPTDIIAWHPIERPQPSEPMTVGACVRFGIKPYFRIPVFEYEQKPWICTGDGIRLPWSEMVKVANEKGILLKIESLGPVTIESPGVEL